MKGEIMGVVVSGKGRLRVPHLDGPASMACCGKAWSIRTRNGCGYRGHCRNRTELES
jgi:hypothetical protein